MKPTDIAQIAAAMRAELPPTGQSERVITDRTRGPLYLALLRRNSHIQLIIGRRDSYPCLEDAATIAGHFGVDAATEAHAITARLASQDGHSIPIRALSYAWTELG